MALANQMIAGNQYLTGLTLFFVGYILFEVPCNIILKRTSPKLWLPTLTVVWGIVSTLQGIIHNLTGFFIVRFFLGIAEGGLFPGESSYSPTREGVHMASEVVLDAF